NNSTYCQTIRDTLIFVLNLHLETMENPEESYTPANIKLKARLLQQLSSACRTLHLVFFQTSVKERMEIIARDRKRIKAKLLSISRKRLDGTNDVARSLQAKLRCDLITNFNKTNLGKHILAHTATSMGGSNMRLTLSPLVLALNTLVAEFLYAQNCHFTLSVFCTEIPYRNTLPDFESMRQFRFNDVEILEIWEAVTGRKAVKKDLHKHVILNYEANPNMSLLLLFIKYLLRKDPSEQLSRNAEVQTELQEKFHKSTLIQVNEQETQVSHKDEQYTSFKSLFKNIIGKVT
ncbi:hypothetical protein DOY81_009633, partial [Sarcophaga bullata]